MTTFYATRFDASALMGATLIVPAVSLGNVPQLTSDLLIASLGMRRVGFVGKGDTVAPFAGRGDDGEIVTGGLELYGQEGSELYVLQQRAPTLKSRKDEHVELLRDFIASHGFSFALLLTSLDAASQDDAQLLTPHQRIVPPSSHGPSSPHQQRLESLLPPLRLNLSPDTPYRSPESSSSAAPYPPFLPAAGLTRRLLAALSQSQVIHGAITAWCVEGDNRGDATSLAGSVLAVLGIGNEVELREPPSWDGLFGTTSGWSGGQGQDSELYG
ncbi:hypothetical protein IAU60_000516 [Kwoniella sp. DSM 27419]